MTQISKDAPVMVTGATGYVAGVLVKKLLQEGFTVHAPVRSPENKEKLKYLDEIAASAKGSIKYFKADLLKEGSYAEAMEGCELVFHTASPFAMHVKDPQKELVDPALKGTQNVLQQVNKTETVKRVVLTSSCVAIFGDNVDVELTPKGIFDEDVWNTTSTLSHNPYSYSKTLAEKEAWQISKAQSRWDLVVVNPHMVIGPGLNPNATSESYKIVKQMGDGTFASGAPKWGTGAVDVRDLAEAHFKAAFTPEANGRYIISGTNTDIFSMSQTLREKYGHYPLPKMAAPKWLLWLFGPFISKGVTRKGVSRNVGVPWKGDNSRGIKELGMTYRPLTESMNDFFQHLIDGGILKKTHG